MALFRCGNVEKEPIDLTEELIQLDVQFSFGSNYAQLKTWWSKTNPVNYPLHIYDTTGSGTSIDVVYLRFTYQNKSGEQHVVEAGTFHGTRTILNGLETFSAENPLDTDLQPVIRRATLND